MSIRGRIVIECDQKGCHAEIVLEPGAGDCNRHEDWIAVEVFARNWWIDDNDVVYCPDCAPDQNPREKGDDDGATYADPRDERERLIHGD